jgi:Fe-S cluster biogenesis protein NfuA
MRPVNIYAELTPNPNSLKFVADVMLLEGGTIEYQNPQQAVNCPLAKQLFSFSGVERVFISSNFVTINKNSELDWFEITNILREFIRGFLMSDEKLFLNSPFSEEHIPAASRTISTPAPSIEKSSDTTSEVEIEPVEADPDAEKKIIALLDEYIRPAVEGDGGAIDFKSFSNGTVRVVLKGACSGCPSSTVTLKSGIENLLKQMVPGVREVIAIQD